MAEDRCFKLFYLLKDKKLSIDEIDRDCFLDIGHYARLVSHYNDAKFESSGDYIIDRKSYIILGIDEGLKKIFCVYARSDLDDVRKALGFEYHYWENVDKLDEGIRIRLQGDLTLRVEKLLNLDTLFSLAFCATSILNDIISALVFNYLYNHDETFKKLMDNVRAYRIIHQFSMLFPEDEELKKLLVQKSDEIYDVISKFITEKDFEHENGIKHLKPPKTDCELYNEYLIDLGKEKIYEILKKISRPIMLKIGNSLSRHVIHMKGIRIGENAFLILEPQDIMITHPEHGENHYYISSAPAIYSFNTR